MMSPLFTAYTEVEYPILGIYSSTSILISALPSCWYYSATCNITIIGAIYSACHYQKHCFFCTISSPLLLFGLLTSTIVKADTTMNTAIINMLSASAAVILPLLLQLLLHLCIDHHCHTVTAAT